MKQSTWLDNFLDYLRLVKESFIPEYSISSGTGHLVTWLEKVLEILIITQKNVHYGGSEAGKPWGAGALYEIVLLQDQGGGGPALFMTGLVSMTITLLSVGWGLFLLQEIKQGLVDGLTICKFQSNSIWLTYLHHEMNPLCLEEAEQNRSCNSQLFIDYYFLCT